MLLSMSIAQARGLAGVTTVASQDYARPAITNVRLEIEELEMATLVNGTEAPQLRVRAVATDTIRLAIREFYLVNRPPTVIENKDGEDTVIEADPQYVFEPEDNATVWVLDAKTLRTELKDAVKLARKGPPQLGRVLIQLPPQPEAHAKGTKWGYAIIETMAGNFTGKVEVPDPDGFPKYTGLGGFKDGFWPPKPADEAKLLVDWHRGDQPLCLDPEKLADVWKVISPPGFPKDNDASPVQEMPTDLSNALKPVWYHRVVKAGDPDNSDWMGYLLMPKRA